MSLNSNSVVVITGAASGIGRALTVRLAQEKIAGIAISDVNEEGLKPSAASLVFTSSDLSRTTKGVYGPEFSLY